MLAFSKLISATMMPSGLRSILVGGVAAVLGAVLLASPATAQGSAPQDLGSVLASQQNLSTYYNLIKRYPEILLQLPNLAGVTIIAPSNAAFANIPYTPLNGVWDEKDPKKTIPLLQYHVLQGVIAAGAIAAGPSIFKPTILTNPAWANVTGGQNVIIAKQPSDEVVITSSLGTRVTVLRSDLVFTGGLIQIIDNLLIPPARLEKTADAFRFPSFLGALYAAHLMPALADEPSVTLFVPRNEALQLIGGTLADLDPDQLARILNYHVIPGQVLPLSALTNGTNLTTSLPLNPAAPDVPPNPVLHIRKSGNDLFVNSARVIQPDILIANGVVHLIDNVLNPDAPMAVPNPSIASQPPVFAPSTPPSPGLVFTSALPCTANCPVTTTSSSASRTRTTTTSLASASSQGGGAGAAAARPACTGLVAAAGALGLGMGMMAGIA